MNYPDTIICTDAGDLASKNAHVVRCDPARYESWAGCIGPRVIACITPDTLRRTEVMEVLRGYCADIYVKVE